MGEAKDEETFAEEYLNDSGLLNDIPESVARYFDIVAYAICLLGISVYMMDTYLT